MVDGKNMKLNVVLNVVGRLIILIGFTMVIPFFVALYYGESTGPFAVSSVVTIIVGTMFLFAFKSQGEWKLREAFAIVAFGWVSVVLFGTIPYLFYDIGFIDALFESMSGFTATGATVLVGIEDYPKGLLFWRSMTQWLGGMGIIVLFISILPKLGVGGRQMFRAEMPGIKEDTLAPHIRGTAKILWMVYLVLTLMQTVSMKIAGASLYDAITHSFTTISCAGFSPYDDSIAAFNSPLIEGIIVVFIFISGVGFALHYKTIYVDRKSLIKDEEFRFYFLVVFCATALLTFLLWRDMGGTLASSFRYAIFQVVSIVTTTGYATVDFNQWSHSAKMVLLALMFFGGCAGSTAGGIKIVRWLLLVKFARREVFNVVHRHAVKRIKYNDKSLQEDVMRSVIAFFIIYVSIFAVGTILLAVMGLDMESSVTASIAALGNVGPGMGIVGPMEGFNSVPGPGKLILSLYMLIGRLEVFTVVVMLTPEFWKKW